MADPRVTGIVTADGVAFKASFVAGARGVATVFMPGASPARDPQGTQAEQSQGRIQFDFNEFTAVFDLLPDTAPLPSYAPVIEAQNLSIDEDGVLNGQFTATDLDENLDPNSWVQVGALPGFTLNADGSFSYTASASFQALNVGENSVAPVVVRVSDLAGTQSAAHSFDIVVTGASDAPTVAALATIVTDANASVLFDLAATDPEDDVSATGWLLSTPPAKGVATINASGLGNSFDPNGEFGSLGANDFEDVTFGVTASDDEGSTSAERTITVRVTGVAQAPVATNGSITLGEDQTSPSVFDLAALCSDPDDDIASYEMLTQPADVSVTFNPASGQGTLTPSPTAFQALKAGQTAQRSFTFRCTDDAGHNSNAATFSITVQGENDAPATLDRTITVNAGARESAIGGWSDVDSASLFVGVAFELVGQLFDVETGATSGVGTLVLLNNTNAPIGSIVPGRMQMRADGGDFATLPAGEVRNLRQLYRVRDSEGVWSTTPGKVDVTVVGTYQAPENFPVMTPIAMQTPAGTPVQYDLINATSDVDGDFGEWRLDAQPVNALGVQKGSFTLISDGTYQTGRLVFSPGNAFDGLAAGSSEVVTGRLHHADLNDNPSNIVNVSVQVTGVAVQSPPDAQNVFLTVEFDQAQVTGQCVATDVDGDLDPNGYLEVTDPSSGEMTIAPNGGIVFTLNGEFLGLAPGTQQTVEGTYTASDAGQRVSAPGKITIVVTNSTTPGTPPRINNITRQCDWQASFIEGRLVDHTVDTENDLDPSTFVMTTDVLEGALTPPDGTADGYWKFSPGVDFLDLAPGTKRQVFFEAEVDDRAAHTSQPGRVTIDVTRPAAAPQSPPVASDTSVSVDADATIVNASVPAATDVDGDLNPNGYALVSAGSPATDGVITFRADGTYDYDPAGAFDGLMMGESTLRVFQYTASDAGGRVSTAKSINVTINGVAMSGGMEPMYPAMMALETKYPFEVSGMSRLAALEQAFPADRVSAKSGAWTDPAVWSPQGVPQAGETVKIAWGHSVVLNEARTQAFSGNKAYKMVFVHGTLQFPTFMNVRLRCDTLVGYYGAHLDMRPSAGIIHEISFPPNGDIDVAKDPALLTRGLVWHGTTLVMGYGAGTPNAKDPYVNCLRSAFPVAGATSVTLAQAPVGWNVGDVLIIPCTEQGKADNVVPVAEDEEVTITAINGAVVSFTPALVYDHDDLPAIATHTKDFGDGKGAGGDLAELTICNFTRNIKFTNEAGNTIPDHQRPHIMLMHRIDGSDIGWCDTEIRDCGRTRKVQKAFTAQQMGSNPIVADTNLKGRYSLHLHWIGVDPTDDVNHGAAMVRRNAFYRSPGWHFAQHRGSATFEDNVGWRAFGHYVAEGGDETGLWRGNIAIRCPARRSNGLTGFVPLAKDGQFVSQHDHGATGQGFFFQGRMVATGKTARGWNRTFGSEGEAIVWNHRPGGGGYVSSTDDSGPHYVNPENWDFGAAIGWRTNKTEPDKPRIAKSQYWQVTGAWRALHVIKNAPVQEHDVRTFFDDVIITGVMHGVMWEYTQHYTARRFLIDHSTRYAKTSAHLGFEVFNNTPDIVLAYGKIGGFGKGITITHLRTGSGAKQPIAGGWGYVFDSVLFGAQAGLGANSADHPNFLETRTGQDGVSGPEDRAFNMTFYSPQAGAVKTFGAPPNAYSTDVHSFGFYKTQQSPAPSAAAEWNINNGGGNFEYRGTVTDAYGAKQVPQYYGPSDPFHIPNDSFDVIARRNDEVSALLARDGYWKTPAGAAYVDDVIVSSNRMLDAPTVTPYRLYLHSATPGINGNPPVSWFGNGAVFPYNGVKA